MLNIKFKSAIAFLSLVFALSPFAINCVNAKENSCLTEQASSQDEFSINKDGALVGYFGKSENVVIPEGVTSIDNFVFQTIRKLRV